MNLRPWAGLAWRARQSGGWDQSFLKRIKSHLQCAQGPHRWRGGTVVVSYQGHFGPVVDQDGSFCESANMAGLIKAVESGMPFHAHGDHG